MSNRILAIIPARGNSKGIPFKNIVNLNGKPLIAYTIEAARESRIFDKIIVSTENKRIENISIRYGARVIRRPKRLAQDKTPTEPVMLHVLGWLEKKEGYKPDIIFLLQPTSPFRDGDDIKAAYRKFNRERLDSLLSVTKNSNFIWQIKKGHLSPINYDYFHRPRRQNLKGQFREDGAIYITKYSIFMKFRNRLGGEIGYHLRDEAKAVEIDTWMDLFVAKKLKNIRWRIR